MPVMGPVVTEKMKEEFFNTVLNLIIESNEGLCRGMLLKASRFPGIDEHRIKGLELLRQATDELLTFDVYDGF